MGQKQSHLNLEPPRDIVTQGDPLSNLKQARAVLFADLDRLTTGEGSTTTLAKIQAEEYIQVIRPGLSDSVLSSLCACSDFDRLNIPAEDCSQSLRAHLGLYAGEGHPQNLSPKGKDAYNYLLRQIAFQHVKAAELADKEEPGRFTDDASSTWFPASLADHVELLLKLDNDSSSDFRLPPSTLTCCRKLVLDGLTETYPLQPQRALFQESTIRLVIRHEPFLALVLMDRTIGTLEREGFDLLSTTMKHGGGGKGERLDHRWIFKPSPVVFDRRVLDVVTVHVSPAQQAAFDQGVPWCEHTGVELLARVLVLPATSESPACVARRVNALLPLTVLLLEKLGGYEALLRQDAKKNRLAETVSEMLKLHLTGGKQKRFPHQFPLVAAKLQWFNVMEHYRAIDRLILIQRLRRIQRKSRSATHREGEDDQKQHAPVFNYDVIRIIVSFVHWSVGPKGFLHKFKVPDSVSHKYVREGLQ